MGNYKPYFKYMKDFTVSVLLIFLVILVFNTLTSVFAMIKVGEHNEGVLDYTSQSIMMGNTLCIGVGLFYSMKLFSQAMIIRADRVGYIKAAFIWGLILAVGMTLFGEVVDALAKTLLEAKTIYKVEVNSIFMLMGSEEFNVSTSVAKKILNNLTIFSVGFMIGALIYRLKIKYSVLLFAGVPLVVFMYLVNLSSRNPERLSYIFVKTIDILEFLIKNQGISTGIQGVVLILCSIVSIRLLIKAPIKDYAHDLI